MKVILVVVASIYLFGCSPENPSQVAVSSATVPESNPRKAPAEPVTDSSKGHVKTAPTKQDAAIWIKTAADLMKEAENISYDPRCNPNMDDLAHLIGERLRSWTDREENWKADFTSTMDRYEASKSKPDPIIMVAVSNLEYSETWLWAARDCIAHGKPVLARQYLKGVQLSTEKANRILTGKDKLDPDDPDKNVVQVPAFIEKADNQMYK